MINYKKAGVDIDTANRFVKDISKMVASTKRPEVLGGIGGFSALMSIPKRYKNPILVSSAISYHIASVEVFD